MGRRIKPIKGNYPEGLEQLFVAPLEHGWGIELRPNLTGTPLEHYARLAIEVAKMNPGVSVMMPFNGIELWIEPNDGANHVVARYEEAVENNITPEQRAEEAAENEVRQAKREQATAEEERLYSRTPYKFPEDFDVSLSRATGKFEVSIRRQVGIMAQWFEERPERRNDDGAVDRKINSIDSLGHSGLSASIVIRNALAIMDKGFEPYLAEQRAYAKQAARQ